MKRVCYGCAGIVAAGCLLPMILGLMEPVQQKPAESKKAEVTAADARAGIVAAYERWGRARVALDRATLDSIMAADFYVSLYGQKLTREKFLSDITKKGVHSHLTRFDTEVLTVRKTGRTWSVVISEKLEFAADDREGGKHKVCCMWVTRDTWRNQDGKWLVTSSEAIGHENWAPDTKPPFNNW